MKFTSTAYLGNSQKPKKPNKPKPKRSDANIERVRRLIEETPTTSSKRRSAQLNISHITLRPINYDDLRMYPYRTVSRKRLLPANHEKRSAYMNFSIKHATLLKIIV